MSQLPTKSEPPPPGDPQGIFRWGGKLQERVVQRLYAKEGHVAFSPPSRRAKVWGLALGGCFGTCIFASVALDFALNIPFKYMQPISALYVVPFLVGLWFLMRPMAGYGTLSALVGHLWSRVALSQLRRLTRVDRAGKVNEQ